MKSREPITALRRIRMSRCMSQTDLAKKMGTAPGMISYLEKNGIRRTSTALKYAKLLCCDPAELMDFTPRPSAEKR